MNIKKTLFALIFALFAAALLVTGASAVGETVGSAVKTDIAAYINNYPIRSFNINGYTAIVAEDLKDYGFNVVWNQSFRTLSITENLYATAITPTQTVKKAPKNRIGEKAFDVLATDIRTFVNGYEVVGYNIGGYTVINFEDLKVFGACRYDNNERALFLSMNRLPSRFYVPVETESNDITSFSLGFSGRVTLVYATSSATLDYEGMMEINLNNLVETNYFVLGSANKEFDNGLEILAYLDSKNGKGYCIYALGDDIDSCPFGVTKDPSPTRSLPAGSFELYSDVTPLFGNAVESQLRYLVGLKNSGVSVARVTVDEVFVTSINENDDLVMPSYMY